MDSRSQTMELREHPGSGCDLPCSGGTDSLCCSCVDMKAASVLELISAALCVRQPSSPAARRELCCCSTIDELHGRSGVQQLGLVRKSSSANPGGGGTMKAVVGVGVCWSEQFVYISNGGMEATQTEHEVRVRIDVDSVDVQGGAGNKACNRACYSPPPGRDKLPSAERPEQLRRSDWARGP